MAFRTEGLRAELGPAGGRVPPTPAEGGAAAGPGGEGGRRLRVLHSTL